MGVTTETVTLPSVAPAGLTATIDVSVIDTMLAAGTRPNSTLVAPLNPEPAIVSSVPPLVGPALGDIELIIGVDMSNLSRSS